ncbi:MAG TPA: D-glycerate dehydrogenase [Tissierellaceae bacterium]|jgi:gluconate 2-dehydrogenase|nr:D-glycerate dehydrogenase [Tissierellaceae bacterium]
MTKPRVFIARKIPKEAEEYIGRYCDYTIWEGQTKLGYDTILDKIHDVEGILLSLIKIDENFLDHAPNLRVVSNYSVGYNNFDIEAMEKRGVIGTNTAGSLDDTVADLIFGLMISTARRIPELDKYVKDGKWRKDDDEIFLGKDISESSLGIIGMGRIGVEVAKRAKLGFNMDVNYYNRNRNIRVEEDLGIKYLSFDSLLRSSDFVVTMTPLNKETYHMMDEREFSLMKEDGIFINASRGKVVNEEALIKALKNKQILAAGLDVFENEPLPLDSPLLSMSNVITLPHIGSTTKRAREKMAMLAAKNLVQALNGEIPDNLVPEFN